MMKYRDMVIEASDPRIEQVTARGNWRRRFKVRVLSSPAGEMAPDEAVAIQCDDTALRKQIKQLDKRELDQEGLVAFGRLLGELMLPRGQNDKMPGVCELFLRSLDLGGQDLGLRVRLRLHPDIAGLPWEYMYVDRSGITDAMAGFISLSPRVSIIRHEVLRVPVPSTRLSGDITMVVALAAKTGTGLDPIDLDQEERNLKKALGQQPGIKATFLKKATLSDVQAAVAGTGIFHFAGHGAYPQKSGERERTTTGWGEIGLEDQWVDAERFAINLHDNGVRLAVLAGCETGRREGTNVWGGIASALVRCQVPAVVANQYLILDKCAIAFSEQFYRALVGGLPIEQAVSFGRRAAYNADPNGRDWGVPVLYLRAADGELFEGAADLDVRDKARRAVESVTITRIGGVTINIGGDSGPPDLKRLAPRDGVPGPQSRDAAATPDSTRQEPSIDAVKAPTAALIETRGGRAGVELASGALRPVLLKLIAELDSDDRHLALQSVFDLAYELARGSDADATLIERLVKNLVELAPKIKPELRDLFNYKDFKDQFPSPAVLALEPSHTKDAPCDLGG